jgi:cell filamentation protein
VTFDPSVTFDLFGDFATRGYLRNVAKAKDPEIVQRLLHNSFLTGIDAALADLKARPSLSYADVLQAHKTLRRSSHGPEKIVTRTRPRSL